MDICLRWLLSRVQYGILLKGPAPILRVLFFFDVSDIFGGGFEVVSEFYQPLHTRWRLFSLKYLGGSPTLPPVLRVSYRSSGGAYFWRIFIVPQFSLILGVFQSSWKDCFATAIDVPGSLVPAFYCSRLVTKKVLSGCLPYL